MTRPRPVMAVDPRSVRAPGGLLRTLALVAGGTLVASAVGFDALWLGWPGCLLVGWAVQPSIDALWMEGFASGLDAATVLLAEDPGEAVRMGGGGEGHRGDESGAAAGRAVPDRGWPREPAANHDVGPVVVDDQRPGPARRARPAFDEEGRPLPTSGPRPSILPELPAVTARGTRSVDHRETDRPPAGVEAGAHQRRRSPTSPK